MLEERVHRMEADLERLAGVHLARMRVENGEIIEIHVVADSDRKPKGIARDVVTTLFAKHGIRVPHQRVSVAATLAEADQPARGTASGKIVVTLVQLARERETYHAVVELHCGGRTARGAADALAIRANRIRVVAAAALRAVRDISDGQPALELDAVRLVRFGRVRVAIVHVVHLCEGTERSLFGCCVVEAGVFEAAASAVLEAVGGVVVGNPLGEELEYEVEEDRQG